MGKFKNKFNYKINSFGPSQKFSEVVHEERPRVLQWKSMRLESSRLRTGPRCQKSVSRVAG